jgi:fumarate hydratase class II
MGLIKRSAAIVNRELGLLESAIANAIEQEAQELMDGRHDDQIIVGAFQTGSGTSMNMNVNEVIASRANEIITGKRGGKEPVHPNDHVNLGQSSNDVFPTAMHVSTSIMLRELLIATLNALAKALDAKARQFDQVVKIGRTHLQDATPIRLGQEFSGYAQQARLAIDRCMKAIKCLRELPLGGTAVGTGINTHPEFAKKAIALIARHTALEFVEAQNHFSAQATKDDFVEAAGHVKTIAVSLSKIANDIRWLASGPRCGIGEIILPAIQPGSSIMPGKVNPVLSEVLMQACAQVIGNEATITWAAAMGSNFELNVMMPVMAHNMIQAIELLGTAAWTFTVLCVNGIEANEERCRSMVEQSLAMVTSLVPVIGYDKAAEIAYESHRTGKTVREIALERKVLPPAELERALDAIRMTEPRMDDLRTGG